MLVNQEQEMGGKEEGVIPAVMLLALGVLCEVSDHTESELMCLSVSTAPLQ